MAKATNRALRLLDDGDDHPGARVRRVGGLTLWAETLAYHTAAAREFVDVTDDVSAVVERSGITQGWVSVFSKHTTATVVLNENEPLLLQDMSAMLDRLSAATGVYGPNDLNRRVGPTEPDEAPTGTPIASTCCWAAAKTSRSLTGGWSWAAGSGSSCWSSIGPATAS